MTDINDLFPSKYLKASDAESPLVLTIKRVTQETMKNRDGKEETKPVIFFEEQEKGMVLNKTNANTLTELFGPTIELWAGERITLISVDVEAFGEVQKALRFKKELVKVDRGVLFNRYQKLYERGKKADIDDLESYVLPADASEQTIIELGKELRKAVEAAEAFS